MMFNKLPLSVQPLFDEYIKLIKANLSDLVYGVYIQGSIALNDYDDLKSDIDYITVLTREPTDEELKKIDYIHNILKKHKNYIVSEGQYTNKKIMSRNQNDHKKRYPRYSDGEFNELNNGYIDPTSLWILKKYGFLVYGHEVKSLSIQVKFNDLISQMDYNLNKYWLSKINYEPELFLEDFWIEFGVLTLCRIWYTLENRNIVSKLQAAKYILDYVDDKWKPIINEAVRIRESTGDSIFSDKQLREDVSVNFIREMIQSCNIEYFESKIEDGI